MLVIDINEPYTVLLYIIILLKLYELMFAKYNRLNVKQFKIWVLIIVTFPPFIIDIAVDVELKITEFNFNIKSLDSKSDR